MRSAIEAQLLGAKVVVVEKRDRMSRNNVLHLWPFVIQDLRGLGAKKFFGKFCAGSIDHISIRQLQCILLKVALILGVEFHESVSFDQLVPPPEDQEGGSELLLSFSPSIALPLSLPCNANLIRSRINWRAEGGGVGVGKGVGASFDPRRLATFTNQLFRGKGDG
jgi:hypothetical protein